MPNVWIESRTRRRPRPRPPPTPRVPFDREAQPSLGNRRISTRSLAPSAAMRRIVCLGVLLAVALAATSTSAAARTPAFTVQTLHFDVTVGPQHDTHCTIV